MSFLRSSRPPASGLGDGKRIVGIVEAWAPCADPGARGRWGARFAQLSC